MKWQADFRNKNKPDSILMKFQNPKNKEDIL